MIVFKKLGNFKSSRAFNRLTPFTRFESYQVLNYNPRSFYVIPSNMNSFLPPQLAPSWNFTPSEILDITNKTIKSSNDLYDCLAQLQKPNIENLVKPFIDHENKVSPLINQLTFLQHVSADKDVRDASTEATQLLQDFEIELSLRYDLFLQFDKVWTEYKNDKEFKKNHFELYKFIEKVHKDYLRAGLNLPLEQRNQVKDIQKKISANSLQFSKNLGEQKESVAFTKDELDGVSETIMQQFEKISDNGVEKYKVTFKYPDILPVLKTANNPETRKRAFASDQNKVEENTTLFLETLKLRNQLAELLGYSTYADYNLDIKMAKKTETVMSFLTDLKGKLNVLGSKEIEVLKSLKEKNCAKLNIPFDGHYYIWDHRYYDNKYLKENYNVDDEEISEYFPLESTIAGMLNIYETVLKLKFVEEIDPSKKKVWHEDVKQLAVWKMDDETNPVFVGWIYFDLHPRDGKYGHAANFGISSSYINSDNERMYPVTALVCNFSKPTSDKPALFKHNEITTFFHELGHGIHDLVGINSIGRFNGPSATPWDFVEAPSQMLEFWTWNKTELTTLSSHYNTGEKIPAHLLDSLISTKHINGALFALRQLTFSLFDMTVHTCKDLDNLDVVSLWNKLREDVSLVENGDLITKGFNSFGHIMSGAYSAGYYGYMWAEVFAADMYHTRFAVDPLNSKAGIEYRDIILGRGGLYEIDDNLTEFLGRKPSNRAFLTELGLH